MSGVVDMNDGSIRRTHNLGEGYYGSRILVVRRPDGSMELRAIPQDQRVAAASILLKREQVRLLVGLIA